MKFSPFTASLVVLHVCFIVVHIYTQSQVVDLSFRKQNNEKHYHDLRTCHQRLTNELAHLHNRTSIKEYAQNHLGMHSISPAQMHTLRVHA